jgi:hypothetical protein
MHLLSKSAIKASADLLPKRWRISADFGSRKYFLELGSGASL